MKNLLLAISTVALMFNAGPAFAQTSFSTVGATAVYEGWGSVNGTDCDAHADVTISTSTDADLVFSNSGSNPLCNIVTVTATIHPNGDVSNVTVSAPTPICTGSLFPGAVLYTLDASNKIINARLAAPLVLTGGCVLDTDVDWISSSDGVSPILN